MTHGTVAREHFQACFLVASFCRGKQIRRGLFLDFLRRGPALFDSFDHNVDLLLRQWSSPILGERSHGSPLPALGDDLVQDFIGNNCQKQRIVVRRRGTTLAIRAMAAGAMGAVERVEILHLIRWNRSVRVLRLARPITSHQKKEQPSCNPQKSYLPVLLVPVRLVPALLVPKLCLGTHFAKLCFAFRHGLKARNGDSRTAFPDRVWERGKEQPSCNPRKPHDTTLSFACGARSGR